VTKQLTLADHAEAWQRERGEAVPERDSAEWDSMYQEWVDFAFGSLPPSIENLPPAGKIKTLVVRKNSIREDVYLDRAGRWAEYRKAKRFRTDTAAERFAEQHGVKVFGLFN
jgi:hypothetical protein